MKRYEISFKGTKLGVFMGETETLALNEMAKGYGYETYALLLISVPKPPKEGDITIKEVA